MPTVMITGANRGIGLELARQYGKAGWHVIACSRGGSEALAQVAGDVERRALDVTDFAAVEALGQRLAGTKIDVLINNAGIAGREAGELGSIDPAVWQRTFLVNTLAPLKVAEAFIGHVAGSEQKKMIAISSRLGSIAQNDGGRYAYRASKTALNMQWKSLALDTDGKGMICAVLHPGWVQTDMGGAAAPVTPPQSAAGMIEVIGRLGRGDSGHFFNYDGREIEW